MILAGAARVPAAAGGVRAGSSLGATPPGPTCGLGVASARILIRSARAAAERAHGTELGVSPEVPGRCFAAYAEVGPVADPLDPARGRRAIEEPDHPGSAG